MTLLQAIVLRHVPNEYMLISCSLCSRRWLEDLHEVPDGHTLEAVTCPSCKSMQVVMYHNGVIANGPVLARLE